jgi:glycosyltransferase involved in cell wall biosynthesis
VTETPKVSVFVLTHDHVDWIGAALDSAIEQEPPFPFEILVADDFSTDGTRETVREYADRHPGLIRTFLPERNLGVAGIWLPAARQCRGEYIAILEGDDYWTSSEKLGLQAALLDSHPEWASCFHRATLFDQDGAFPPRQATPDFDRDVFGLDDLIRACLVPFLTVMFRRDLLAEIPEWVFSYAWFDWLFHIYCARRGDIGFHDADLAAYRVHSGGNWSSRDRDFQLEQDLEVYERLLRELPERGALIERCVEHRQCQLAVEDAAVPVRRPVVLVDPVGDMPAYFNGRWSVSYVPSAVAGGGAKSAAETLRDAWNEGGEQALERLHYSSRKPPRELGGEAACAVVVPASADAAVAADPELSALLAGAGEPLGRGSWGRLHAVTLDSAVIASPGYGGEAGIMGALVEIVDVSVSQPAELHGAFVDEPKPGAVLDAHGVDLLGWVLGEHTRVTAVEFLMDGKVFWRAAVRAERPDLAEAYADYPDAGGAGFRTTLNLIGTPQDFEIELTAVLKGQRRVPFGILRGRHRWRHDSSPEFAELVSVVIPCFGQAHFLTEAVESVLAQTYPHLEILVIDDASPDNASQIAARYPGVRSVRGENAGMAGARNLGIRNTSGDIIVFLDADDRLLPQAIETGIEMLEKHPESAAAIGTYQRISQDGRPIVTHEQPIVRREHYARLLTENWAGFPARAVYRRAVFEHVKGFDPELDAAADFGLNLEVVRQFPVWSHGALVAEHRKHGDNSSGDAARMLSQTLAAVRRQRPHTKRDPDLRRAYKAARRHWKAYYGELLVSQIGESVRERRLAKALRQTGTLIRHYPRGVLRLPGARRRPLPA